jgi:hypothetical protein
VRTIARAPLVAIVIGAASCAYSSGPEYHPEELQFALEVEPYLTPGAVRVKLFEPMQDSAVDEAFDHVKVTIAPDGRGGSLARAVLDVPVSNDVFESFFSVGDDGALTRLARPDGSPPFHGETAASPFGGGIAVCGSATFALSSGALVQASSTLGCNTGPAIGPSNAAGDFASAIPNGSGTVTFSATRFSDGAVERTKDAPSPNGGVVYVEETQAGQFVAVVQTASGLAVVRSDGTSREAPIAMGTPIASERDAGGDVVLFLPDGSAVFWAIDDATSAPAAVAAPPPPGDFAQQAWIAAGSPGAAYVGSFAPNPTFDQGRVPNAYAAKRWTHRAFDAKAVPTTPCASRAKCRMFGESFLVAVLDTPKGGVGLYAYWSWSSLLAFYAAPIDRTEAP